MGVFSIQIKFNIQINMEHDMKKRIQIGLGLLFLLGVGSAFATNISNNTRYPVRIRLGRLTAFCPAYSKVIPPNENHDFGSACTIVNVSAWYQSDPSKKEMWTKIGFMEGHWTVVQNIVISEIVQETGEVKLKVSIRGGAGNSKEMVEQEEK